MHKNIDQERDQTEERKKMHRNIDKARDKTEKRKQIHHEYDHTATRRFYLAKKYQEKKQSSLLKTLTTDTGFDVICSSCLQYKNLEYCKSINVLNKDKKKRFLKNRSEGQFVCNLCFKDIKQDKNPQKKSSEYI